MGSQTKEVPVEAHRSVGKVERYHKILRRSYDIINEETKELKIDKDVKLQMAVKTIIDSAGPDGHVPTLLVFGAYPKMTYLDPPAPKISQRATALKIAMEEVRKLKASR